MVNTVQKVMEEGNHFGEGEFLKKTKEDTKRLWTAKHAEERWTRTLSDRDNDGRRVLYFRRRHRRCK